MKIKKMTLALIAAAVCSAFTMNASAQQADQAISDAVISTVKAQWAVDIKDPTNVAKQSKDQSEDYTEFNGQYATRVDSKATNLRLAEGAAKSSEKRIAAECLIPRYRFTMGTWPF